MKKIDCQPKSWVRKPPSSGPIAAEAAIVAPHAPNAVPRSRPRNSCASSDSEVANMIAPPIPWPARASTRNSELGDSAHSSEVRLNSPSPIMNRSLRPYRSASEPIVSSTEASVSAYASITHWMSEKLACREVAIFGSATFTIVMSSSSMNVATQTTISVHHLRSISRDSIIAAGEAPLRASGLTSMYACASACSPSG